MAVRILNPASFMAKPKAIVFDTDNTLYEYQPAHAKALAAAREKAYNLFKISAKSFDEGYEQARRETKNRLGNTASSHNRMLYFQRLIEIIGLKTQLLQTLDLTQTYWRTFLAHATLFPDAREFIMDVKSHGCATAILTDLTADIQFRKIVYFGLEDSFDYVITSEEAGQDKPARAPFELTLQKLQADPATTWMIGDNSCTDIQGARAMGMVTLQKNHQGVVLARGAQEVDAIFDHFGELRRWFASLQWPD